MNTTGKTFVSSNNGELSTDQLKHEACDYVIFVDINTIPPMDLPNWIIKNARYFKEKDPNQENIFKIGMKNIPDEKFPAWLKENQNQIDFTSSASIIECIHRIINVPADILNGKLPAKYKLTLKEIKNMITHEKGNFETCKYEKHVSFYEDKGNLKIKLIEFQKKKNCFSFPLLREIVSRGLNDSSVFSFYIINDDEIIFSVNSNGIDAAYYDFSHIPPLIPDESVYAS